MGLGREKPAESEKACDCPVSDGLLKRWLSARRAGGILVLSLLHEARNALERRALGILSLFASDETLEREVFGNPEHPDHWVLRCRDRTRELERLNDDG